MDVIVCFVLSTYAHSMVLSLRPKLRDERAGQGKHAFYHFDAVIGPFPSLTPRLCFASVDLSEQSIDAVNPLALALLLVNSDATKWLIGRND